VSRESNPEGRCCASDGDKLLVVGCNNASSFCRASVCLLSRKHESSPSDRLMSHVGQSLMVRLQHRAQHNLLAMKERRFSFLSRLKQIFVDVFVRFKLVTLANL